jgi:2-oxoglutarate ferredoxin oxidoreductase subunit gamma
MNNPSLQAFEPRLKPEGTLFLNSSLITQKVQRQDIEVIPIPANEISARVGEKRTANMVMLGAYIARTEVISHETILAGLKEFFQKKIQYLNVNTKAFEKGIEYSKG